MLNTLMLVPVLSSCRRQKLEEPYLFLSHIPVSIDWSKSMLDVDNVRNVSICFYPKHGGEPIIKVSDNIFYNVVDIPIGEYSILVYNEMVRDVVGVAYTNDYTYDKFTVGASLLRDYTCEFYSSCPDEKFVVPHSRMAAWNMDSFVVDKEMVDYTRSEDFEDYIAQMQSKADELMATRVDNAGITRVPVLALPDSGEEPTKAPTKALEELSNVLMPPKTTVIKCRVRIENLNSAMLVKAIVKGTAKASYMSRDENIATTGNRNLYELIIKNREYDNPSYGIDGYVNFTLNTFGREPSNENYDISFRILLQTGELMEFERDITDQVKSYDGHLIDISLSSDDDKLTLEKYTEAGFNVDGWGDDVILYL